MSELGQYVGKDGRTYRVYGISTYTDDTCHAGGLECVDLCPDAPDWPAARAALDALVEQEAGEWVTWKEHGTGNTFRIKRDGSGQIERVCKSLDGSTDATYPVGLVTYAEDAYRKGREVALEESSALRDAARELVETVNDATGEARVLHLARPTKAEWEEVVAAAKTLEGKL